MPVVAPKPYALTTVEALLEYMSEPPSSSGAQRNRAQGLINSYSKAALRYTKRQWKPTEDATDKLFAYTGNGFLSLSPYEARAIHTVTLYTDQPESGWQVLANQTPTQAAQWLPNPRHKTDQGTYWSLTLPEIGRFHPYYDEPVTTLTRHNLEYQVTVNADWGVAEDETPDDIELAVWIACANAWDNPEGYRRRRGGAIDGEDYDDHVEGSEDGLSLPRASRALLHDYRRRSVGVR